MIRISEKDLEQRIEYLNELTGNSTAYSTGETPFKANVGNYHLDCAYGGYKLSQVTNIDGGVSNITSGYCTKRELMDKLNMYIQGIGCGRSNKEV